MMDKLAYYIQNGKELRIKKLFCIFIGLGFVWGLIVYGLLSYLFYSTQMQEFIRDLPTINIQDGRIQYPTDMEWHQPIPYMDAWVYLDTTKETWDTFPQPNALYMAKENYSIVFQGQVQTEAWPQETSVIGPEVTQKAIRAALPRASVLIGVLALVFLWLGYLGTYLLSRIILKLGIPTPDKWMLRRASFVGWMSVVLLNFILLCFGRGLSLFLSVIAACVITVFSVVQATRSH